MTPLYIKQKLSCDYVAVPCGKCPTCLSRRASGWSFRLLREGLHADTAYFLTITYDTDHVPITQAGYMGLAPRDLQLFFKRIRKRVSAHAAEGLLPIKYYSVGEYGTIRMRPHYHAIVFNLPLEYLISELDQKVLAYSDYDGKANIRFYDWNKGMISVGKVSGASIGYCLKYLTKQGKVPLHCKDDRIPEFSRMSKGLGAGYLTPAMKAWHKADLTERMYINLADGKKASMPRYYKDKIYTESERAIISAHYHQIHVVNDQLKAEDYDARKEYDLALSHIASIARMHRRHNDSAHTL